MDAITLPDVRCGHGRPSRVVLIPRRWNQARGRFHGRRGLTSPVPRGEREAAVKTIAQGRPVVVAEPVVACVRKVHFLCTQGSRVRPASGLPCALSCSRTRCLQDPDTFAPRECGVVRRLSSPAKAGDPVFQRQSSSAEKPRRTGCPGQAGARQRSKWSRWRIKAQFCNRTPSIATVALELASGTLDSSMSWRSVPLIQRLRVIL